MQSAYLNRMVSDIVRDDYRTAEVFKKYGINFCCGGQQLLKEACDLRKIKYEEIENDLVTSTRNLSLSNNLRFSEWKEDFLIDYIINVHHAYLRDFLPRLEAGLRSFADGHRKKFPEMQKLADVFSDLARLLLENNRYEEETIFPYIKQIVNTHRRKETYGNLFVRTLRKPLQNIEGEHRKIGMLMDELRKLTHQYQFPSNACTNHQVIFRQLREFDNDTVQHKHLENNILFPKAIELEKELLQW